MEKTDHIYVLFLSLNDPFFIILDKILKTFHR